MKRLMILLAVLLITSVSYGENGPSPLVTPGSVSGLGTIATVDSPVPVANGGTGATTAAAGLAALGGASLNGSSTVAFNASTINGVEPLTAAEKTQALVGSSTVDFAALNIKASNIDVGGGSAATPSVQLANGYGFYQLGPTAVAYSHGGGARLVFDADGVYMNSGVFRVLEKTPASATATGLVGTVCWDASYVYICVAANTWKRVAISTW